MRGFPNALLHVAAGIEIEASAAARREEGVCPRIVYFFLGASSRLETVWEASGNVWEPSGHHLDFVSPSGRRLDPKRTVQELCARKRGYRKRFGGHVWRPSEKVSENRLKTV